MKAILTGSRGARHAVVFLAVLAGTALTAQFVYELRGNYVAATEAAGSRTRNLARVLEEHARQSLSRVELNLARAAEDIENVDGRAPTDPAALRQRLRAQLPRDGLIRAFVIFDRGGAIVLSTLSEDVRGLPGAADRDYFEAHRERAGVGMVIGAAIKSRVTGTWTLPVSYRLTGPGGAFMGVLLASVDPLHFQRFYDSIDTGANGFVTMFQRQGWIVVRSPFNEEVLARNWAESPMFRTNVPVSEVDTVRRVMVSDNVERIFSYRALKEYPIIVSLGLSLTDILAPWRTRAWHDAVFLLVVLAALAGAALALARQLHKRETTQIALRESEERQRLAVQASNVGLWDWDLATNVVRFSPEWKSQLGYLDEELPGRYEEWERRLHPADRERTLVQLAQSLAPPWPRYELEFRLRHKNGEYRWIDARGDLQRDAAGKPARMLGCHIDVTERRRAEEALRESEERLRLALDAAHMGTFDWDIARNRIIWSRWHEELWGYKPGEFAGTYEAFAERVHRDDAPGIDTEVDRCITTREPFNREFRVVWPDASVHWVLATGEFTFGADGRAQRMRGVVAEATERKSAEDTMRKQALIFANSTDALFILDRERHILDWNAAAERLFGYSRQEMLGKTTAMLYPAENYAEYTKHIDAALARGETWSIERPMLRKDGTTRICETVRAPILDANGALTGRVGVTRDVTERKRAEALMGEEKSVLEMISSSSPLPPILATIARSVETISRGTLCSILLLDADGAHVRHGAAPSLPEDYNRAIDGQAIGPNAGSCGTAAYRNQQVIVTDITTDPLWADYRALALQHGLRACWSTPIRAGDGRVLGTFALYYREPRAPDAHDVELIERYSRLTSIAIGRKQAEAALREHAQRLQAVSRQLLEVQEDERRMLARELHDEVGQTLAALKINLQVIERERAATKVAPKIAESVQILDQALTQVRTLLQELRSPQLDELGLASALRAHAERQTANAGLRLHFSAPAVVPKLIHVIETACFRIAQGALTNVLLHAGAKNVWIDFALAGGVSRLTVRDDGKGFDLNISRELAAQGVSLGLISMEERAMLAGGRLEIITAPGGGGTVRAEFPLSNAAHDAHAASTA